MNLNEFPYLNDFRLVERIVLTENRVTSYLASLPRCREREELYLIADMLKSEGFDPHDFCVDEYPTEGVYYIKTWTEMASPKYFLVVALDDNQLDLMTKYNLKYPLSPATTVNGVVTCCSTLVESMTYFDMNKE